MLAAVLLAAALTAPPRPTEYVTDNAHALSATAVENLDAELKHFEDVTGHRVVVWIGDTTGDVSLEDWTIKAAETWKIGRKGHDDGAILFLFTQDHRIRIEVGYGLESSLTDAESSRIIRDTITPEMRAGNADAAVQNGVDQILLTITPSFKDQIGHAVAQPSSDNSETTPWESLIFILIIIAIFVLPLFFMRNRRRGAFAGWFFGSGFGSGGFGGGGLGGGGFGGGFGGGGASGGW